jgi:transmembrane sensor
MGMWNPSDSLLAEYLAGACGDADVDAIERWVAEDPANRARLEELRLIWQEPWPPVAADVDAMWAGVRAAMHPARAAQVVPARPPLSNRTFQIKHRSLWRVPLAAAVALGVAGGALAMFRLSANSATERAAEPMREYATPRGQRVTVQLSDGTRLVLAPASRLRVPVNYGRSVREVHLEGEALFDVVHDARRPFRVLAKNAVAEDLGTRFAVRAYAEDSAVAVAVAEGVVALGRAGASSASGRAAGDVAQGVILRPGELGTLAPDGRVRMDTGAVARAHLMWAEEGRLWFVETPLPEALRALGRWYDLDVRLEAPALAARTITAEFGAQSPDEAVRALALAVDARVTQVGKVVTLRSKS